MKIGVVYAADAALENYPHKADYIDVLAFPLVTMPDESWRELLLRVGDGRIRTNSSVCLFGSDVHLTGPEASLSALRDYADKVLYRLDALGIKTVVFGSGGARRIPEGFSTEQGWEQLYATGEVLADLAKTHGQTIVVEPLSYAEDNTVNTVEDAARYARIVKRENFKILADFYHMEKNGESFDTVLKNGALLAYAHFAAPQTRQGPKTEEEWAFFDRAVASLRAAGYAGDLTFEGKYDTVDELDSIAADMKSRLLTLA